MTTPQTCSMATPEPGALAAAEPSVKAYTPEEIALTMQVSELRRNLDRALEELDKVQIERGELKASNRELLKALNSALAYINSNKFPATYRDLLRVAVAAENEAAS